MPNIKFRRLGGQRNHVTQLSHNFFIVFFDWKMRNLSNFLKHWRERLTHCWWDLFDFCSSFFPLIPGWFQFFGGTMIVTVSWNDVYLVRLLGTKNIPTFETFIGYLSCVLLWVLLGVRNGRFVTNKSHQNHRRESVRYPSFSPSSMACASLVGEQIRRSSNNKQY